MRSSVGVWVTVVMWVGTACGGTQGQTTDGGEQPDTGPGPELDGGAASDSGPAHDGSTADSSTADSGTADSGAATDSGSIRESGSLRKTAGFLPSLGVHAVGNQIYDGAKLIRLLGVDRPGTEYQCVNDEGIFDGPSDQASITAMLTWDVNAVRVPLNDDCWLGLNGVNALYSGAPYQKAISDYVTLLLANGIYPILDLHWTEDAGALAVGQQPMPDANAIAFWTSVAGVFGTQNKVIFDLFNEPYPDSNNDATSAWVCWANGGSTWPGVAYPGRRHESGCPRRAWRGRDQLRGPGRSGVCERPVAMAGLRAARQQHRRLVARLHQQQLHPRLHTFAQDAAPSLALFPVVATEIGDATGTACDGKFITTIMDYLDAPGTGIPPQSYLAWSWSTDNTPHLLSDYTGTPTCDGPTYMAHLIAEQ